MSTEAGFSPETAVIVPQKKGALVLHDPVLVEVAKRFGWLPATLAERIISALPSVVEQQVYLQIAGYYGTYPESFAKVLRLYLGDEELQIYDLGRGGRAVPVLQYAMNALEIIRRDRDDLDLGIAMNLTARLARVFGEEAIRVVEEVANNLGAIAEAVGWKIEELSGEDFRRKARIESEVIDTVQTRIASADSLGGENPLIVMGLSPDITELGLDDDDLWEYCRAISRWLLAHFHPDRCKDRESVLIQQRYADAFELLKDRKVFNKSLEDFKKKMRWQRSEVNNLIKTGSELRRSREDAVGDLKRTNRQLKYEGVI